jgi:hypothetical protein
MRLEWGDWYVSGIEVLADAPNIQSAGIQSAGVQASPD